jgi:hypothetical protein
LLTQAACDAIVQGCLQAPANRSHIKVPRLPPLPHHPPTQRGSAHCIVGYTVHPMRHSLRVWHTVPEYRQIPEPMACYVTYIDSMVNMFMCQPTHIFLTLREKHGLIAPTPGLTWVLAVWART